MTIQRRRGRAAVGDLSTKAPNGQSARQNSALAKGTRKSDGRRDIAERETLCEYTRNGAAAAIGAARNSGSRPRVSATYRAEPPFTEEVRGSLRPVTGTAAGSGVTVGTA